MPCAVCPVPGAVPPCEAPWAPQFACWPTALAAATPASSTAMPAWMAELLNHSRKNATESRLKEPFGQVWTSASTPQPNAPVKSEMSTFRLSASSTAELKCRTASSSPRSGFGFVARTSSSASAKACLSTVVNVLSLIRDAVIAASNASAASTRATTIAALPDRPAIDDSVRRRASPACGFRLPAGLRGLGKGSMMTAVLNCRAHDGANDPSNNPHLSSMGMRFTLGACICMLALCSMHLHACICSMHLHAGGKVGG